MTDVRTIKKFVEPLRARISEQLAKAGAAAADTTAIPAVPVTRDARGRREPGEAAVSDGLLTVAAHQLSIWRQLQPYALKLAERLRERAEDVQQIDARTAMSLLNSASRFALRSRSASLSA